MKCNKPFVVDGQAHACGQCLACRINRRRLWSHRILLESLERSDNSFITLTYSDDHLPLLSGKTSSTLVPAHLRDWLKRLRKKVAPIRLRYFAVGEYGDETQRPHYHAAVFGLSACSYGTTRYAKSTWKKCCPSCDLVYETWGHGNIFIGELNATTAQYVAGYVCKKMTAKDDLRLDGRHPEFARMSLKPGIGASMMDEVGSILLSMDEDELPDVPSALRHGASLLPLGRYLRQQLRLRIGRDKKTPDAVLEIRKEEMRPLRDFAFLNSQSFKEVVREFYAPETERLERLFKIRTRSKML